MASLIIEIIELILRVCGMWFIFQKCGINRLWALVPVANNYKLAQCAGDEDSGSVWCISNFILNVFLVAEGVLRDYHRDGTTAYFMVYIISVVFIIINIVYGIRIYSELCLVFKRSKKWVIFWVLNDNIVAFIWGISKKFNPVVSNNATAVTDSGMTVEGISEGLSINIDSRTARKGLFGKRDLLRDVHLNIAPGKMVLLLGGSGAGKTTFINAVTGYEKANAKITLNGNDVYKDFEKVIYDIGVVPQQELVRNTDTVFRTLMDAAALRMPADISIKIRKDRVNEVMDIFGLTPVKNNMISKQSGGQKKRISIAMEYISDPSLFILDEPDSGLDGILAKELMHKLHEISREGKIVIVVTHTPDRVIDLFDEVIVLAKDESRTGRLVFNGPVDEARKFFEVETMEEIIKTINRPEEGGLGRADELLKKFHEINGEVSTNE